MGAEIKIGDELFNGSPVVSLFKLDWDPFTV